jgi:hypothetical protein
VEKKSKPQRKLGRWQANQTRKEKEHNSPSGFTSAAIRLSEKFSTRKKSKRKLPTFLFLFFFFASLFVI